MDEFRRWMEACFKRAHPHGLENGHTVRMDSGTEPRIGMSAEQAQALALHLLTLAGGPLAGLLTAEALVAIRKRAEGAGYEYHHTSPTLRTVTHASARDVSALLTDRDALTTALATLRAEVDALRLLVTDLCHPHGDGAEREARVYRAGALDERRRVLALIRGWADAWRGGGPGTADGSQTAHVVLDTLDDLAMKIERGEPDHA